MGSTVWLQSKQVWAPDPIEICPVVRKKVLMKKTTYCNINLILVIPPIWLAILGYKISGGKFMVENNQKIAL